MTEQPLPEQWTSPVAVAAEMTVAEAVQDFRDGWPVPVDGDGTAALERVRVLEDIILSAAVAFKEAENDGSRGMGAGYLRSQLWKAYKEALEAHADHYVALAKAGIN